MTYLKVTYSSALAPGSDIEIVGNFVNQELQKLGSWLRANELAINTSKTKIMVFSNKKNIPLFNFVFNNNDLDKPNDPALISPLEHITNNPKVPAIKMCIPRRQFDLQLSLQ